LGVGEKETTVAKKRENTFLEREKGALLKHGENGCMDGANRTKKKAKAIGEPMEGVCQGVGGVWGERKGCESAGGSFPLLRRPSLLKTGDVTCCLYGGLGLLQPRDGTGVALSTSPSG